MVANGRQTSPAALTPVRACTMHQPPGRFFPSVTAPSVSGGWPGGARRKTT